MKNNPSIAARFGAKLSENDVQDTMDRSQEGLYKLIENYLGNDPALKEIADKLLKEGGDALKAVKNGDDAYLSADPLRSQQLEVIVRTDGSRPCFLIKDDIVDTNSSTVSAWNDRFPADDVALKAAIQCVGRVNLGLKHIGTGFLVSRNLMVTNLHVLQSIGRLDAQGNWRLAPNVNIDFGFEFGGRTAVNTRLLKKVIFYGPQPITQRDLDHKKLDLALIQLEEVPADKLPAGIVQWNTSPLLLAPDTEIFTIGYPGDPGRNGAVVYTETLLDQLFKRTFGYKHLSPGLVMWPDAAEEAWTIDHDATTLGGCSGSPVFVFDNKTAVAALHYGGELATPRQNWSHNLANVWEYIAGVNPGVIEILQQEQIIH